MSHADTELYEALNERDHFKLSLEAERHARRKDNEYLLAENQRLRDAVQAFIAAGSNPRTPEYAALVREVQALAGDAE